MSFLDEKIGWHAFLLNGGLVPLPVDSISPITGMNIVYSVIGMNEIEIKAPLRILIWRQDCLYDGMRQRIENEGIEVVRFRWNYEKEKWLIFLVDDGNEFHQEFTCKT